MKNISVVLLAVFAIGFAALADAAPKKRTRNANRIGPYAMGAIGQSSWTGNQSESEQFILDNFQDAEIPLQDLSVKTDDSDIGYNATFGYRFTRYLAAELGLTQFGSLETVGQADADLGEGFVPVTLKLNFTAGGPMVSALGILPVNDRFEFYGRLGYVFASARREFSSRVDGQSGGLGRAKGDSQNMVLGLGAAWNFNQVYSARLEYQKLDEMGEANTTGEEDLSVVSLGLVVRF